MTYICLYFLIESISCPIPTDVKCNDTGVCIHYDKICDGKSDCMDGSDEENCGMYLTCIRIYIYCIQ